MRFLKMHGLGNDFIIIDGRSGQAAPSARLIAALADRHQGVGFDQLAYFDERACKLHLVFYNADGSLSAACGNATRCIARLIMDETGQREINLHTDRGALYAEDAGGGKTRVNMGQPLLNWQDIPLAQDVDTLHLPIDGDPVGTGMGNPHCSFFVDDAEAVDLEAQGAQIEHHPLFPQRTNVQFASRIGDNHLRMRVWERGVGVTLASGSSSCAVAVAAARRGLTGRDVRIELDGGSIWISWRDDGVWMEGETMHVFDATLSPQFLEKFA